MSIILTSWNMQGEGCRTSRGARSPKYNSLMNHLQNTKNLPKVIGQITMLQETGPSGTTGFKENEVYGDHKCVLSRKDPTAINERCTTAILISNSLMNNKYNLNTGILEYQSYRPLLFITLNVDTNNPPIMFSTIHSIANQGSSVPQIKMCVNRLIKDYGDWFFIGDFNSKPDNPSNYFTDRLYKDNFPNNTTRRHYVDSVRWDVKRGCDIVYTDGNTQGKNGIRVNKLDFMFCTEELSMCLEDFELHNEIMKDNGNNVLSDHNLLWTQINLGIED